ncbi:hypothetical protein [Rhizobium leguminosarum]|uniref:hypothetical protein n=1 Tax=Rhizobium leguminosarum TaxID=384 RepID=UPI00144227E7|nr:hypothetical protein [Rhizobium leguminosarum]
MNKHILSAALRRDEAEALVVVEEFNRSRWHKSLLFHSSGLRSERYSASAGRSMASIQMTAAGASMARMIVIASSSPLFGRHNRELEPRPVGSSPQ